MEVQENCIREAVAEGAKAAAYSLAAASAAVFGAAHFFPGFKRSLNVSAKTALIVSPAFGAFFLLGELAMNECAQRNRHLQRTFQAARRAEAEAAAAAKR